MRIVIDLQGAQAPGSRHRGIGRYCLALSKAILRNAAAHDVHLLLNGAFADSVKELREVFRELLPQQNIHVWNPLSPSAQRNEENLGRHTSSEDLREAFIRRLKPDVVHVSSLFEGMHDDVVCGVGQLFTDIPTTVTLFDLIPLINKEMYLQDPKVARWYMDRIEHLRRADACLAISESARQEAVNYLDIPPARTVNVGTAADPQFKRRTIESVEEEKLRATYGLQKPFVMYTGGIDPRKNIEALIRAYALLPQDVRREHQLAIVCSVVDADRNRLAALAMEAGLEPGEVVMTGFVPEEHLIDLYSLTALFVFPSLHEGFGLPALEAMHCGAPVIASNCSSLPEVVDFDAALFDPNDEVAIAESIARGLQDSEYILQLKANSERQARAFSWDECGRRAIAAFEQLAASRMLGSRSGTRPRLAYVSPMPPAKSGIANYTADLLPQLSRHYRIDAVVKDRDVELVDSSRIPVGVEIRSESSFRATWRDYDRIVYQFGNSDHHDHMFSLLRETGGVVVLHDFFLSGILAHLEWSNEDPGVWAAELYRSHGYAASLFRKSAPAEVDALWRFPCSQSVIEAADRVIVHSGFSLQLARGWYGNEIAARFTIIPHLREAVVGEIDKAGARKKLGLGDRDFIVCSFGFISPTKLSHNLLEAWEQSKLRDDPTCKLIFVGENHPGDYGKELNRAVEAFEGKSEVSIAGWTDTDRYRTYLAAADMAVQLRTLSRGETSGAVLDCMNFGLPLIVNASGSMKDLSQDAAYILPEQFETAELSAKLGEMFSNAELRRRMSTAGRRVIGEEHSPAVCADSYMRTLEDAAREASIMQKFVADIQSAGLSATEVGQLAMELADLTSDVRPRLFIDVSELAVSDARTGIQRVVRNILMQLLLEEDPNFRAEPVYTDPHTREFRFARKFTSEFLGVQIGGLPDDVVDVTSRDYLLFLDLNPVGVPVLKEKIARCKLRGTQCIYVVYDLLAVKHPEFFLPDADAYYHQWLECVAEGTAALCISNAVACDLRSYLQEKGFGEALTISHFPLGSDMDEVTTAYHRAPSSETAVERPRSFGLDFEKPTFLMVGTIEPRKKHAEVVDAFETLWAEGHDVNLCVIGRQGWMVDDLAERLASLARRESRFVWEASLSDSELDILYQESTCLIAASADEGFGLPLVEGARRGLHLIARDIPVFREVCGDQAEYFQDDNLTSVLRAWVAKYRAGAVHKPEQLRTYSWRQSAKSLLQLIAESAPSV